MIGAFPMLCVHLIEEQYNMRLKLATAAAIKPQASFTICQMSVLVSYPEHIEEVWLLLITLIFWAGMP